MPHDVDTLTPVAPDDLGPQPYKPRHAAPEAPAIGVAAVPQESHLGVLAYLRIGRPTKDGALS